MTGGDGLVARLMARLRGSDAADADPLAALTARVGTGPLDCEEVALVLQAVLDAEVGHDLARRVGEHLEDCRRCGLEADTYRALKVSVAHRHDGEGLDATSVARLRQFGQRLAAGEVPFDEG